jgi:hypothetical protein
MKNPTACTLTADDSQARAARWLELARRSGLEISETPTGLRLALSADAATELEALAALERDCCAFADWTVKAAGDVVVVEIAADGEAAPVAQALFAGLARQIA